MTYYFELYNEKTNKISIRKAKGKSRMIALKALINQFKKVKRKLENYTILEASSAPIQKTI